MPSRRWWGLMARGIMLAGAPLAAQDAIAAGELPPVGYGALNQDQLTVRFGAQDLEIRFAPLDERLLRLLAPDAYRTLRGLVDERRAAIDSAAAVEGISAPGLVLVSFFARQRDARFEPENLSLIWRGQLERPAAILPINANFSGRQLGTRQQASAIYLYSQPVPVFEPFAISYNGVTSGGWEQALPRIDRERSRVLARWQTERDRGRDSVATPP